MKVGFIADVHLANYTLGAGEYISGCNARARLTATALRAATTNYGLDELWILGDLFDTATPSPQIIGLAMESLCSGCRVKIIRGNHDMVSANVGDNALQPLKFLPSVTLYEEPCVVDVGGLSAWVLPFPHTPFNAQPPDCKLDLVLFHAGMHLPSDPDFLKSGSVSAEDLIRWMDSRRHPVLMALAGDWHQHRMMYKGRLIQVGVFAPKTFSDAYDHAGCLVIMDTTTFSRSVGGVMLPSFRLESVPGPRFCKASTPEEAEQQATTFIQRGCFPFVSYAKKSHGDKPPAVKGAVFKADVEAPVHVEALPTGDALRREAAHMNEKELLSKYLRRAHPENWTPMFETITKYMP